MAFSHLPLFSLPPDLGVSSLPEDLHPFCLTTLGLRGAAQELLHVEVQTALSCLDCVNSVLPGLKSVFSPFRPLFSWHGLIKTSLPCFLPCTPPKDIYITVDKYSICCKNEWPHFSIIFAQSYSFQWLLKPEDKKKKQNGFYPLIKYFILHCTVPAFGSGIRTK